MRKTNNATITEIVGYKPEGDTVKAFYSSGSLKKLGWKGHSGNIPASYLAGFVCARKALKAGIKDAVLDIGLATPVHGSRIFAALKGAIDGGVSIPADEKVFPAAERVEGRHISAEVNKNFEEVKKAIEKEFGG